MCWSPPLCTPLFGSWAHWGQMYRCIRNNQFIFLMSVQHSGKRRYLTVCIWRRCLQSFSSSVCKQGLCSPDRIKHIKRWSHFLCRDILVQHNQPNNDNSHHARYWKSKYLQDGLDPSLDRILWPDDDICPNLLFSLGTSELVGKRKQTDKSS